MTCYSTELNGVRKTKACDESHQVYFDLINKYKWKCDEVDMGSSFTMSGGFKLLQRISLLVKTSRFCFF